MIIAITGTPGTGKTAVAKILAKELGANLISLASLLKKGEISSVSDRGRKTEIVDIRGVKSAVKKSLKRGGINIIDGHLSHFINSDLIIILRCRPDVLEMRMRKRRWPEKKIRENIQAEILDSVTIEALEIHSSRKLVEIDTTSQTPEKTAKTVEKVLNNHALQRKYVAGKVDWSEQFSKCLIGQETKGKARKERGVLWARG